MLKYSMNECQPDKSNTSSPAESFHITVGPSLVQTQKVNITNSPDIGGGEETGVDGFEPP